MVKIGDLVTPTGRLVLGAGQLKSEKWLQLRRWRKEVPGHYCIGSSDVPSILDLEGVDTPAHVYRNKVSDIRPEPNEQMNWGSIFEAPIALEWCRRNRAVIDEIGLVSREDTPWHQSTIDRRVRECPVWPERSREHAICGLEVKHMDFASASRWHADLPDRIYAQLLHQLYVTGYEHMHYAAKVPGTMKQGVIFADRERKVMDYVIGEVERFRNEHLLAGVEPEWNVSEKPDKMIALDEATHPKRVGELDINGIGEVMAYAQASREASDTEAERKRWNARLRQLADGHEIMKFAGEKAYRLGPTSRTNVDLDKLSEKYPDAYADPEVVSTTKSHTIYIDKAYKVSKPKGEK